MEVLLFAKLSVRNARCHMADGAAWPSCDVFIIALALQSSLFRISRHVQDMLRQHGLQKWACQFPARHSFGHGSLFRWFAPKKQLQIYMMRIVPNRPSHQHQHARCQAWQNYDGNECFHWRRGHGLSILGSGKFVPILFLLRVNLWHQTGQITHRWLGPNKTIRVHMSSEQNHGESAEEELFDLLTCHRSEPWTFKMKTFGVSFLQCFGDGLYAVFACAFPQTWG